MYIMTITTLESPISNKIHYYNIIILDGINVLYDMHAGFTLDCPIYI